MKNEPKTEDIANRVVFSLHIFNVDDFRSDISWRTAANKEIFLSLRKFCKSKVCNNALPVALSSEDKVFRLEITMHDSL